MRASEAAGSARAAIFTSRESLLVLLRCVEAAAGALPERSVIDILVNGNVGLANTAAEHFQRAAGGSVDVRVWSIRLGDKANAWNWYVHELWAPADWTYFIDGYVRVRPGALTALARAATEQPRAMAATGVPTSGPSAKGSREYMLVYGGIHGNLHVLPRTTVELIRARGFRLPIGIYRTDSVLGAALSFGMDPASIRWDPRGFIAVSAEATWDRDEDAWWSYGRMLGQLKRRTRQAQGDLENAAVSHVLARQRLRPEQLPATVDDLVLGWAEARPDQARRRTWTSPFGMLALRKLRTGRDWSGAQIHPQLLCTSPATRPCG